MELRIQQIKDYVKKNRLPVLVLLCGVFLMLLPTEKKKTEAMPPVKIVQEEESLEKRLEEILSQLNGAGRVQVLLTKQSGEEKVYQVDAQSLTDGERLEQKENTVTVTLSDRQQEGLISQIRAPVYRGAVVVCQGGGNPAVKLSVVEAVSGVTGLPSNRITVLKMK